MSIETKCTNCGEEHDMRHEYCPGCTIDIELRDAHPPYKTWKAKGYIPFEMYGERWAVTDMPHPYLNPGIPFRVSHVETGAAAPHSVGKTPIEAKRNFVAALEKAGPEKLKAALAAVKTKITPNPA